MQSSQNKPTTKNDKAYQAQHVRYEKIKKKLNILSKIPYPNAPSSVLIKQLIQYANEKSKFEKQRMLKSDDIAKGWDFLKSSLTEHRRNAEEYRAIKPKPQSSNNSVFDFFKNKYKYCFYNKDDYLNESQALTDFLAFCFQQLSDPKKFNYQYLLLIAHLFFKPIDQKSITEALKTTPAIPEIYTSNRVYKGVVEKLSILKNDGGICHTVLQVKKLAKKILEIKEAKSETDDKHVLKESNRNKKIYFWKEMSMDAVYMHRPFIELVTQEFYRFFITGQPKTRFAAIAINEIEQFGIISEGVPGFIPLNEIVYPDINPDDPIANQKKYERIEQVKETICNGESNLGEILVLSLWFNEIDLKLGNLGLSNAGKIVKIDGECNFTDLSRKLERRKNVLGYILSKTESPNFSITSKDLDRLPFVYDYQPHQWLDLISNGGKFNKLTGEVVESNVLLPNNLRNQKPFRDEINQALLKIILLDEVFISQFMGFYINEPTLLKSLTENLLQRKQQLENAALKNKSFIEYLHSHSGTVINDFYKNQVPLFCFIEKENASKLFNSTLSDKAVDKLNLLLDQLKKQNDTEIKATELKTPSKQETKATKPELKISKNLEVNKPDHKEIPNSTEVSNPKLKEISKRSEASNPEFKKITNSTEATKPYLKEIPKSTQATKPELKEISKSSEKIIITQQVSDNGEVKLGIHVADLSDQLSMQTLNTAIDSYRKYKDAFCLRWFFSSNESYQAAKMMKAEKNDFNRYKIAMAYINKFPKKAFSVELQKAMQQSRRANSTPPEMANL